MIIFPKFCLIVHNSLFDLIQSKIFIINFYSNSAKVIQRNRQALPSSEEPHWRALGYMGILLRQEESLEDQPKVLVR